MFECEICGRELVDDANYCDVCGSLQPKQPSSYFVPLDIAYNAATTLVQMWNDTPEAEKVAITSAIATYLLTKSSDMFMYLRDWLQKEYESSKSEAT